MADRESAIIPLDRVERAILFIRGQKVMLDVDLAKLYRTTTKRLNQQVTRNQKRFPSDFMFQLTPDEWESLRSQIATSKPGRGGRRVAPSAFTEHDAIMAANVLSSPRAVHASIQVVRAFVRLLELVSSSKELAHRLDALERKYDGQLKVVFDAVRQLMTRPQPRVPRIGFHVGRDSG